MTQKLGKSRHEIHCLDFRQINKSNKFKHKKNIFSVNIPKKKTVASPLRRDLPEAGASIPINSVIQ